MIERIGVLGLWHLGSVTAACLAAHFPVIGFDEAELPILDLQKGRAPLYEPGLNELIQAGLKTGNLVFKLANAENLRATQLDLLWLAIDTPVDEEDRADINAVLGPLRRVLGLIHPPTLVVISSQLPVGTCANLQAEFPHIDFACVPENLRLGQAISTFSQPDRFIAGVRTERARVLLEPILQRFTAHLIWMSPESAEMTKHALNSFLALSVTFANEVARLCEVTGADMMSVSAGLKSDRRIGPLAYLAPGEAFAGGTLARDVLMLTNLAAISHEKTGVLDAIRPSNDAHKGWAFNKLKSRYPELKGRTILLLGLSYKPGTDTLRRSSGIELADHLIAEGCEVWAWDPVIEKLSPELGTRIHLADALEEAIRLADALIVVTNRPEFLNQPWRELIKKMKVPVVLDAGRFLQAQMPQNEIIYLSVGTV